MQCMSDASPGSLFSATASGPSGFRLDVTNSAAAAQIGIIRKTVEASEVYCHVEAFG
jgi:hypothetical protein